MRFEPYASSVSPSPKNSLSAQSLTLLAFWTVCVGLAFTGLVSESWWRLSIFALGCATLFLLPLWFSLQWDLVRHYVPEMPRDIWTQNSIGGIVLGGCAGLIFGGAGALTAMRLAPDTVSYTMSAFLVLAAAVAGTALGFALLGWMQAKALGPYVKAAWRWIGVMAIAWLPVPLAWLGYEEILRTMVVNIYPQAHGIAKFLAAQAALLCPSLAVFALIIRRTLDAPTTVGSKPAYLRARLRGVVAALLLPPLIVIIVFGVLGVAQGIRVERAWVAVEGPAEYLHFSSDGRVETLPPAGEPWQPKLRDSSPDGSTRAEVEGPLIVISATKGTEGVRTIRTIEVFSGPPPENYYASDAINIVRLSPDGALLAAGTGHVREGDSYINASFDHSVHLWSVKDGGALYTLSGPEYTVRALAWSPDGRYLAAGGGLEPEANYFEETGVDNVVRVWDLDARHGGETEPPRVAFTLVGHKTTVEALAWSQDGSRLASRDLSGLVVIWRRP
jgi:hypothetical protein